MLVTETTPTERHPMSIHAKTAKILSAAENSGEDLSGFHIGEWNADTDQSNLPFVLVDGTLVQDDKQLAEVRQACLDSGYTTEVDADGVYLVSRER